MNKSYQYTEEDKQFCIQHYNIDMGADELSKRFNVKSSTFRKQIARWREQGVAIKTRIHKIGEIVTAKQGCGTVTRQKTASGWIYLYSEGRKNQSKTPNTFHNAEAEIGTVRERQSGVYMKTENGWKYLKIDSPHYPKHAVRTKQPNPQAPRKPRPKKMIQHTVTTTKKLTLPNEIAGKSIAKGRNSKGAYEVDKNPTKMNMPVQRTDLIEYVIDRRTTYHVKPENEAAFRIRHGLTANA